MELLQQGLRMNLYGSGDHSGGIWAGGKNAAGSLDGTAWVSTAEQWQGIGLAATGVEGDTPHGGAHAA
jgi:hypothetical protein